MSGADKVSAASRFDQFLFLLNKLQKKESVHILMSDEKFAPVLALMV